MPAPYKCSLFILWFTLSIEQPFCLSEANKNFYL